MQRGTGNSEQTTQASVRALACKAGQLGNALRRALFRVLPGGVGLCGDAGLQELWQQDGGACRRDQHRHKDGNGSSSVCTCVCACGSDGQQAAGQRAAAQGRGMRLGPRTLWLDFADQQHAELYNQLDTVLCAQGTQLWQGRLCGKAGVAGC